MAKIRLKYAEQAEPVEIDVDRRVDGSTAAYRVGLPDGAHDVTVIFTGEGHGWLKRDGRIVPFTAVRREDTLEVWVRGRRHTFELADRTARRTADEGALIAGGEITAAMPGTILQIHVKPGDTFDAHQPLIVMESMKMEMTLSAPHPGRVESIDCEVGQLVEMGAVLVRVERADQDDVTPGGA